MGRRCVKVSFDRRPFPGGSVWFLNEDSTCPDRKQEPICGAADPVKVWGEVGVQQEEEKEWRWQ